MGGFNIGLMGRPRWGSMDNFDVAMPGGSMPDPMGGGQGGVYGAPQGGGINTVGGAPQTGLMMGGEAFRGRPSVPVTPGISPIVGRPRMRTPLPPPAPAPVAAPPPPPAAQGPVMSPTSPGGFTTRGGSPIASMLPGRRGGDFNNQLAAAVRRLRGRGMMPARGEEGGGFANSPWGRMAGAGGQFGRIGGNVARGLSRLGGMF